MNVLFSSRHGRWSPKATQKFAFSFLAGSQLAMNHFNARDPSVVPELENLANCDVYFPPQSVLDSSFVGDTAIQALWSATLDQAIQTENNFGVENITHQAGLPCAVLGPMDSRATEEVVAVTSALKIPQLFYHAELDRFYHGGKDNSIATVLSPNARAQIMADMFQQMKRDYIAVIHYGKDGSSDLAEELVDIAGTTGMVVETFQRGFSPGSLDILLDNLFDTGITTVVLNFDNPRALSSLSSGLDVRGMFGDEFLYVISPDAAPTDRIAEIYGGHDAGSPMDKLLSGSLVFDHVDPFRLQKDDSFLLAWRGQGSAFVDTLNELHPLAPDNEAYFQAEPDFFKNYDPSNYVSFVYDAIMTLGFGACNASSSAINDDTGDSGVDLTRLMQGMTQTSFHGASGPISFEKDQTYRASKDITVGLYNIRSDTNGTGKRSYNASLACIWKGASGWGALAESSIIYRNGSTNPPVVLRNIEYNYLSIGVRAIGLSFFALGLFLAFGALVAIIHLRKDAIVQRAQPFFLGLLCVGSSITNFASFTISWDEGAGGSVEQLDVACIATPWFFFIGNITIFR